MLRVQQQSFDLGAEANLFAQSAAGAGAIVTFSGHVRGDHGMTAMMIEHYPAMTKTAIAAIMDDARARWSLLDVLVIHRFGHLAVGEAIMMVATAASHRKDAFAAAEYVMDYLKSRAPFWKQEIGPDGAKWVDAKPQDEADLNRW
jgi:molybdopterin synthase catalytic subunit